MVLATNRAANGTISSADINAIAADTNTANAMATNARAGVDLLDIAIFNVRDPQYAGGAKGTGTLAGGGNDDTACIAAAAAAMIAAGGGILYFPWSTGYYKCTSLPTFPMPTATGTLPYAVRGDGSTMSKINLRGTTRASSLTVNNPLFDPNSGSTGAPEWNNLTIDGTGSSGGCSGLQWGDVSYPMFTDIDFRNFSSGDGLFFTNQYGWTEGVQMTNVRSEYNGTQIRFDVGSGRVLGTITTALVSGTAYASIAVSGGVSEAMYSGQSFTIAVATSAVGVFTQTLVTTAAVAQGAVSIPVVSFTAGAAFAAGTAKVHFGGYGSYDYWKVHSLYLQGTSDQHGWVSEVSRGLGEKMDRLGCKIAVTGNFRANTTNAGIAMWIKGTDRYSDTVWDFSLETGGTGVAHKSLQLDKTTSSIGGIDKFSFYGFTTATLQLYQWEFDGIACVQGVSGPSATTFVRMYAPGRTNIFGGVRPSGYQTAVTSGTSWQNTTGKNVLVTIPVTYTGAGTAAWNTDTYSGVVQTATPQAGGPSGVKQPITFLHHADEWAILTVVNGTIGTPWIQYQ